MKAIAKTGPQRGLDLIEVPEPRVGPGEVLVQVRACGICGSDLHFYLSELGAERLLSGFPRVLGHEPAGVVLEVGEGVEGFRAGDHVAGDPHGACGRCRACREGDLTLCDRVPVMGVGRDGALAPLMTAPAPCLYRVPETLDFTTVSLLEPLSVGVHAVEISSMRAGDTVAVLGPGPIGLMTALAARAAGAATVVVTGLGIDQGRLEIARQLGFPTVNVEAERPYEAIRELTGERGAAVVFDTTGALPDVHRMARKGGELLLIGWPSRALSHDELMQLFFRGITVTPSRARPPAIWPRVIDLVVSGRIDPRPLVTHELALADGIRGFELLVKREAMKVEIVP
ncbi:MAG: alcohol dehydrogenase catalytic domain-containing protein [Candidatus Rokubacteria bacterium]|nr:alcohol dehydrogenase catalytic domain-containing protein [Candidatus Rokubacteria bacterium]